MKEIPYVTYFLSLDLYYLSIWNCNQWLTIYKGNSYIKCNTCIFTTRYNTCSRHGFMVYFSFYHFWPLRVRSNASLSSTISSLNLNPLSKGNSSIKYHLHIHHSLQCLQELQLQTLLLLLLLLPLTLLIYCIH